MKAEFVVEAVNDIADGYELFKNNKGKNVCVFGSARIAKESSVYRVAMEVGKRLALEGYTIVNGAGPSLMSAVSKGAFEVNGNVIGCGIKLPFEQSLNKFLTKSHMFKNFYIRKRFLLMDATAIIVFPGGYGTLDELFEILCLIQTEKFNKIPVILYGTKFWEGLDNWIKTSLMNEQVIGSDDPNLYFITNNINEIMENLKGNIKN